MQARGPLMIEHRLIENMIALIKRELKQIETTNQVDPLMIDKVVDFIRVYADRTHHGKEEDILFKKLENKNMSDQDKQIIESGSARMLNLIRKGTAKKDLAAVVRNLASVGVAVEAMCFTDFPTESYADAMATLRWLDTHSEAIALFMCGRFQLTSGSAVAGRPSDFGIRDTWYVGGDDLRTTLWYEEETASKTAVEIEQIEVRLRRISRHWQLRGYPWAGSLSTAHTLLWYARFGPQIFKQLARIEDLHPGVHAAALPLRVRAVAEHAFTNEANIWQELVRERRTVTPERYRRLAENLPSLSVRKTSKFSG